MPFLRLALFFNNQFYLLPVMIFLYELNGLSASTFVMFHSIFFITAMIFSLPLGILADKIPRKKLLITSSFLAILRLLLLLYGHGLMIIFSAEVLFALSRICVNASLSSYVYDYCQISHKKMLAQYGKIQSCMAYGTAFSALVCMIIYPLYGLMPLMVIEFNVNLLSLIFFWLIPNFYIKHKHIFSVSKFKQIFHITNSHFPLNHFLIFSLICASMTSVFVATFQPLMTLTHLPSVFFGAVYFINHFIRGFFAKRSKFFIHHIGPRSLIKVAAILTLISCGLIISAFMGINTESIIVVLTVVCFTIGLQLSVQIFTTTRLQRYVPYELRSTSAALCDLFVFSGRSLFLVIFGLLVSQSFIYAFGIFVVFLTCFFTYLLFSNQSTKNLFLFFKR